MHSRIVQFASIVICTVIIWLYSTSNLILYIHPRYLQFTVGFVSVGLVLLVIASTSVKSYRVSRSGWIVVIVAVIALLFPPQSLSEQIAVSRENKALYQSDGPNPTTYDSFSTDLTRFSVADWSRLLGSSPSSTQVVGKEADIIGFIFENSSSQKFIARFQLTCCAVDATPLTLPLLDTPQSSALNIGEWMSIQGVMVEAKNNTYPYQLHITSSRVIPEPKEPYVY